MPSKAKKYSWLIGLEKFIQGAGISGLVYLICYFTGDDPELIKPVIIGLGVAVLNALKFFLKKK